MLIFADTETTGLEFEKTDRICSLSMIKVDDDFNVVDERSQYFNPDREVTPEAAAGNGLSWGILKNKPRFRDVAKAIKNFVGPDDIIVCHNAPFDIGFLKIEFKRCGIPFSCKSFDTLELSRDIFNSRRKYVKHDLDSLTKYFHLNNLRGKSHGSLVDAKMLMNLYPHLRRLEKETKDLGIFWTYRQLVEACSSYSKSVTVEGCNKSKRYFKGKVWLDREQDYSDLINNYRGYIVLNTRDGLMSFWLNNISVTIDSFLS